ncbi:hypothetical protein [Paenibacillus rigui]|nr:hypothetical protein [Paenibacillus rigui]
MAEFSAYFHQHWLSAVLVLGVLIAAILVYLYRDHIIIKGSGRK